MDQNNPPWWVTAIAAVIAAAMGTAIIYLPVAFVRECGWQVLHPFAEWLWLLGRC